MSAALRRSVLHQMLEQIAVAARTPDAAARPQCVAGAIGRHVAEPGLLEGFHLPPAAERYTRYLLAEDPDGAYAVAALVWRPGQMSRVHGHRTWCALGVHDGVLTETTYAQARADGALPEPCHTRLRRPGDLSHGPAGEALIHRIANLGTRDAISVHVYGVRFEHFSTSVNRIFAA